MLYGVSYYPKNKDNVGYTKTLPAGLTDLFGVTVEEVEPIFNSNRDKVELKLKDKTVVSLDRDWCDLLGGNAQMIGTYMDSYKAGSGVISKHAYGDGTAYYLGVGVDAQGLQALLDEVCTTAGVVRHPFTPVEKVEVTKRIHEGKELYYNMNFTGETTEIALDGTYQDCVTGKQISDKKLAIPPIGYAVILKED